MSGELIFLAGLIIVGFTVLFFLMRKQQPSKDLVEVIRMLQQGSKDDRKVLLDSLQQNTQHLNQRLDRAAQVIGDVQKNIGQMTELGRGMKEIQEFLRSPKLRGNIGEQILKDVLAQMLPTQSFSFQYRFKSGASVDAAVVTKNGVIPIDAKFPLESFRSMNTSEDELTRDRARKQFVTDVKKHIRDISGKYILPDEGTIDYALMYIPSEAIYYEVANDNELFEFAGKLRVLPVSPTTFYAFLKAILMSFEGQKIEAQAREILKALRSIQQEYEKTESALSILTRHITNTFNMLNTFTSHFTVLGQRIQTTKQIPGTNEHENTKSNHQFIKQANNQ